jgi:NitT/TauT family transport system substrate-binding protein
MAVALIRSKLRRCAVPGVVALLLLGPLAACGSDDNDGGSDKIVLVQSAENVAFLPTYLADAKGFWKDQGLDVEIRELGDNSAINSALISGGAQVAVSQSDGPVRALLEGAPAMWLAANATSRPTMTFVLRKGVLDDKGITEDEWEAMSYEERTKVYKGLRFGTFGPGGLIDTVVTAVIKAAGLTDDDITRVTIGGAGEMLAALVAGTIDVMALSPPGPVQAIADGQGVLIGNPSDVSDTLTEFAYESVSLMKKWTEDNPEVAKKIGAGFAEACNYARTADPATMASELQDAGWFEGFDEEVLSESLAGMQDAVPEDCAITQASIDNLLEVNKSIGKFTDAELATLDLNEGGLWTNEFLK